MTIAAFPEVRNEDPSQAATLVVSCAAGGGTPDTTARLVAARLGERLGSPVAVKNMPGPGSLQATLEVAKARPDGNTLLFATNSAICFTPILYKDAKYDPMRDFTPVVMLASNPFVLAVNADLPARVSDLIRHVKQMPKRLSYASFGMGTSHIFMELFMKEAGIELNHVAHPGSAAQVLDAVSTGSVHMAFVDPKVIVERETSDGVRFIGLSTISRHPAVPDIPTIAESGLPSYDANSWVSVVAPAKTPSNIAERLRAACREIVASTEFNQYLATNGFAPLDIRTTDGMTRFFKSEILKWGDVLRGAGLAGIKQASA
jgi:tripartite-type tricarboxylate transporter receptor subunit TctC